MTSELSRRRTQIMETAKAMNWTPSQEEEALREAGAIVPLTEEQKTQAYASHDGLTLAKLGQFIRAIESGTYDEVLFMIEYALDDRTEYLSTHAIADAQGVPAIEEETQDGDEPRQT